MKTTFNLIDSMVADVKPVRRLGAIIGPSRLLPAETQLPSQREAAR